MINGIVKWFNSRKGYGFITTEEGKEIFVHHSEIVKEEDEFKTLHDNDKVKFDIFYGISDNPRSWFDISYTKKTLNYTPKDNAEKCIRSPKF